MQMFNALVPNVTLDLDAVAVEHNVALDGCDGCDTCHTCSTCQGDH